MYRSIIPDKIFYFEAKVPSPFDKGYGIVVHGSNEFVFKCYHLASKRFFSCSCSEGFEFDSEDFISYDIPENVTGLDCMKMSEAVLKETWKYDKPITKLEVLYLAIKNFLFKRK